MGHKEVPVTQLRKQMLEELQRRNYSQTTVNSYLKIVESFAKHLAVLRRRDRRHSPQPSIPLSSLYRYGPRTRAFTNFF